MKIGDYVRTKYDIAKCINAIPIRENSFLYEFDREVYEDTVFLTASELEKYKTSPNIIDLIEVGDYVNGYLVKYVSDDGVYIDIPFVDSESIGCNVDLIRTEEIETILTKEQFGSLEYKIGE